MDDRVLGRGLWLNRGALLRKLHGVRTVLLKLLRLELQSVQVRDIWWVVLLQGLVRLLLIGRLLVTILCAVDWLDLILRYIVGLLLHKLLLIILMISFWSILNLINLTSLAVLEIVRQLPKVVNFRILIFRLDAEGLHIRLCCRWSNI